ncbi:MAG: hypothetical protein KDA71_08380 [Planctomycetales bacterium]|nr:hypothetical protein [Planctomycetales bacterium]
MIDMMVFCVLAFTGVIMAAMLGHYSLGPLGDAMRRLNAPTRFAMGDMLWLAVLIQLAIGASTALYQDAFRAGSRSFVMTMLLAGALGIWVGGVSTMSRAGITQTWRRGVCTLVLLPLAIALMMIAIFAIVAGPIVLLLLAQNGGRVAVRGTWHLTSAAWIAMFVAAIIVIAVLVVVVRRLSGWLIAVPANGRGRVGEDPYPDDADAHANEDQGGISPTG